MKFRVSTENGDSYGFDAKNLAEAQALAGQWHEGERFTVYEDRSLVSGAFLFRRTAR